MSNEYQNQKWCYRPSSIETYKYNKIETKLFEKCYNIEIDGRQ